MPSSLRSRRRRTATAGPSRTLSTTPSARAMDLQLSRCSFQRCAIQLHLSPAAASPRVQIDANHVPWVRVRFALEVKVRPLPRSTRDELHELLPAIVAIPRDHAPASLARNPRDWERNAPL